MFTIFEVWVAWRYLKSKRQDGFISLVAWFSLAGIALGVATLIIVLSVMNGFRHELLTRILGINGHIRIQSEVASSGIEDFESIIKTVTALPEVISTTAIVESQVLITSIDKAQGALVRGIRKTDLLQSNLVFENITRGSIEDFEDGNGVILGERLANSLGVNVNDTVTLLSPKGQNTVMGELPRSRSYEVLALFNIGMYEYDSGIVYMPLAHSQKFFLLPDKVNRIEVFLKNPELALKTRLKIKALTGNTLRPYAWQQIHAQFFNALKVERNVMFLILTLIIVVAAFNVISSLIMLVNDKAKGIAIMRTIGVTRASILRIFIITGSSIGIFGTLLGVIVGLSFTHNIDSIRVWLEGFSGTELWSPEIRFLSQLPAIVDPSEVCLVVIISLVLSLFATIYPSWRAARLNPAEALRYE
jgi:lipoprotein-releasing system permease protein